VFAKLTAIIYKIFAKLIAVIYNQIYKSKSEMKAKAAMLIPTVTYSSSFESAIWATPYII
jgi:hypothetical protein